VFHLSRRADASKSRVFWSWKTRGGAAPDFGDPTVSTVYSLCVYDGASGTPTLQMSATVPPAGTCINGPCWKPLGKGAATGNLRFFDIDCHWDGISQIVLKQSQSGRVKLLVHGVGVGLRLPVPSGDALFQRDAVIVQLLTSDGGCWQSRYDPAPIIDRPDYFKDKCGRGRQSGC
jgi:hypothetical protein